MTRYQFPNGFYGEAGIQPGFLLSAKDNYDGDYASYKDRNFVVAFRGTYTFQKKE